MVEILVEAEIRPTEDVEKVKKALSTVVKLTEVDISEISPGFRVIRVTCRDLGCLEPFKNTIRHQQIEPAVRSYMSRNRGLDVLYLLIHKQAAYAGWISLVDSERESPLGPIRVEIRGSTSELDQVIKYLTGE